MADIKGNYLTKLCCSRSCNEELDETLINKKSLRTYSTFVYGKEIDNKEAEVDEDQQLTSEKRLKLEGFFQHIILNAPVDFTNQEIKDIQAAVATMLKRIKTRVNSRGILKIASILSGGSMAEKTSIMKYELGDI